MREYTIIRPGRPGIVADDETIVEVLIGLAVGTFTLVVADDASDEEDTHQ